MQKVCVVGLGYVGLPTASLLANRGFRVHGVDVNSATIETINRGEAHIYEPDLDVLVRSAVFSGNLKASLKTQAADIFILAVPTPFQADHKPDISYIQAATEAVAPYLCPGNLVILESTSPVGTTEKIKSWINELRPELSEIEIAHCPERILPGKVLKEIIENDRIIGGIDAMSTERAISFYKQFVTGEILGTDARTAELAKLSENAFRDVNIAFANELSLVCDRFDINPWEVIRLANRHPRVNILNPGPGVGGHCIAVDPWFIVDSAPEQTSLMRTAREVNDSKPLAVLSKIRQAAAAMSNPTIACFGLSYKANIDDLRESPAVLVTQLLANENIGTTWVVEPHIECLPPMLENLGVSLVSVEAAVQKADIAVLLVDHQQFLEIKPEQLCGKVIIDTRGVWCS